MFTTNGSWPHLGEWSPIHRCHRIFVRRYTLGVLSQNRGGEGPDPPACCNVDSPLTAVRCRCSDVWAEIQNEASSTCTHDSSWTADRALRPDSSSRAKVSASRWLASTSAVFRRRFSCRFSGTDTDCASVDVVIPHRSGCIKALVNLVHEHGTPYTSSNQRHSFGNRPPSAVRWSQNCLDDLHAFLTMSLSTWDE